MPRGRRKSPSPEDSMEEEEESYSDGPGPSSGSKSEEQEEVEDVKPKKNTSMADAMAKILSKETDKEPILEKFKASDHRLEKEKKQNNQRRLAMEKKKKWREKGHKIPTTVMTEKEKKLAGIATRGVVRLFNAMAQHKQEERKLSRKSWSARKRKKREAEEANRLPKDQFLRLLKGEKPIEEPSKRVKGKWAVLRKDFAHTQEGEESGEGGDQ